MPILSSFLLLQSLSASLLGLSALLITSPTRVLTSPTLSLLGSSMHIRPAQFIPAAPLKSGFSDQTTNPLISLTRSAKTQLTGSEKELLALLGIILSMIGLSLAILAGPLRFSKSELTSRTTDDGKVVRKSSPEVGESIAKLNLSQTTWQIFSGVHVIVSSIFVAWMYLFKSEKYGRSSSPRAVESESWGLLANDVTFTLAMADMLFWGYLYTVIKEERRQVMQAREKRRDEDEEDDVNNRTT